MNQPVPYFHQWQDLGAKPIGTYVFTLPTEIPDGVESVEVWLEQRNQGVNGKCSIQDMAGHQYASAIGDVLNTWATCRCKVPVDSNKQFKVVITVAAVYACVVGMTEYTMGTVDPIHESRLIPEEVEDVHVNVIVHSVDSQYGGKIGAQSGDPGQVSGAGGAVTGEDYAGVRVLGCWNVGKVFGGGNVGGMTSTDELKLVFSHSFLLHKLGKPFDFETCVFKRWNATTHVWDDLNAEQFQVAAKLCGGVKSSADLGVELWIKTSTAGETFLFGAVQPD